MNTSVTDAGLARLKPLVHLEELNLSESGVTDTGSENLKSFETRPVNQGVRRVLRLAAATEPIEDSPQLGGVRGLAVAEEAAVRSSRGR